MRNRFAIILSCCWCFYVPQLPLNVLANADVPISENEFSLACSDTAAPPASSDEFKKGDVKNNELTAACIMLQWRVLTVRRWIRLFRISPLRKIHSRWLVSCSGSEPPTTRLKNVTLKMMSSLWHAWWHNFEHLKRVQVGYSQCDVSMASSSSIIVKAEVPHKNGVTKIITSMSFIVLVTLDSVVSTGDTSVSDIDLMLELVERSELSW
jgi:hypothetical protein